MGQQGVEWGGNKKSGKFLGKVTNIRVRVSQVKQDFSKCRKWCV